MPSRRPTAAHIRLVLAGTAVGEGGAPLAAVVSQIAQPSENSQIRQKQSPLRLDRSEEEKLWRDGKKFSEMDDPLQRKHTSRERNREPSREVARESGGHRMSLW